MAVVQWGQLHTRHGSSGAEVALTRGGAHDQPGPRAGSFSLLLLPLSRYSFATSHSLPPSRTRPAAQKETAAAKQDMRKRDKAKVAAAKPLLQQSTKNCQLHLKAGLWACREGAVFSCCCLSVPILLAQLSRTLGFDAVKFALQTLRSSAAPASLPARPALCYPCRWVLPWPS